MVVGIYVHIVSLILRVVSHLDYDKIIPQFIIDCNNNILESDRCNGSTPMSPETPATHHMPRLAFTSFPLHIVPHSDMNGIAQHPMQCLYSPYSWQRWGLDRLKHHLFGLVPRANFRVV